MGWPRPATPPRTTSRVPRRSSTSSPTPKRRRSTRRSSRRNRSCSRSDPEARSPGRVGATRRKEVLMDHERQEDKRSDPPSEGVRIIGAEEAAEALERGDVAQRRGEDQPRYGDRPHSPSADGPRPVLRFPLGSSSDPRDIERPVVAAQDPISEQVELPHWTEPATGQVPQILPDPPDGDGGDLDDWASFASSTPR